MNAHIDHLTIIKDASGQPAFVVLPIDEYMALTGQKTNIEKTVPSPVVNMVFDNDWTPARAWREHLKLTQAVVAERMRVSQSAYAQLEASKKIRKSSRVKIANALGISQEQLDF